MGDSSGAHVFHGRARVVDVITVSEVVAATACDRRRTRRYEALRTRTNFLLQGGGGGGGGLHCRG